MAGHINDAFPVAEKAVKTLIINYFKCKNKEIYPKSYREMAVSIQMFDKTKKLDKSIIDRNSILCYPDECAYIPVPTSNNEDIKKYWNLKLGVYEHESVLKSMGEVPTIEYFKQMVDGNNDDKMHMFKRIIQHIAILFGHAVAVLNYLRAEYPDLLKTITLEQDEKTKTLYLKDSRFPDKKVLFVIGYEFIPQDPEDLEKAKILYAEYLKTLELEKKEKEERLAAERAKQMVIPKMSEQNSEVNKITKVTKAKKKETKLVEENVSKKRSSKKKLNEKKKGK